MWIQVPLMKGSFKNGDLYTLAEGSTRLWFNPICDRSNLMKSGSELFTGRVYGAYDTHLRGSPVVSMAIRYLRAGLKSLRWKMTGNRVKSRIYEKHQTQDRSWSDDFIACSEVIGLQAILASLFRNLTKWLKSGNILCSSWNSVTVLFQRVLSQSGSFAAILIFSTQSFSTCKPCT